MKFWPLSALFAVLSLDSVAAVPIADGKLVTFADAFSRKFSVQSTSLEWTSADKDGTYVVTDSTSKSLIFQNVASDANETFVDAADLGFEYYAYYIQPSRDHVLFAANYTKQYRHSFFANYYVFNRAEKKVVPLVEDQKGDIQYAAWSTAGNTIAFVRGNDLYVWANGTVSRITSDGGPDVFNGVPDWVYEEEIYSDRKALWFSPDGQYLAFLRFNETGVPTYTVPYYMAHRDIAPTYPEELEIRYPKVGETNPTVTFHLLSLSSLKVQDVEPKSFKPEDLLITEVAWVTDDHKNVIFRSMNRVQDLEKLVLVDVEAGTSSVVRERDGTDGWLDNNLAIQYVPGLNTPSYLDLSDHTGYTHLYLYPVAGGNPIPLTSGNWEVTEVTKVDAKRGVVYYISAERDSTERHLYSVSLDGKDKKALVDTQTPGFWAASFSDGAEYYILSYNGPDIPWQKLYSTNSTTKSLKTLNDNAALASKVVEYNLPKLTWSTLQHPDGYSLNVLERLPANFDPAKKYPVLFKIYGGPGSQEVTKTYKRIDWLTYISSDPELSFIVLTVDNRGTGFKGRSFRSQVSKHLGSLEAQDQVYAATQWSQKPYVDASKIAIWGWSYGGYLTSKVLELDSRAFSLGLITAPVSDWRFYDSMYTERYMKLPATNAAGYEASAVTKPAGFKNVPGGFLLQHGTGDDNVHFQNSAVLVDGLMRAGVGPAKMEVQWFTDSDHGITWHGGSMFLYKQLTGRLWDEKRRVVDLDGEKKHQWEKRVGA